MNTDNRLLKRLGISFPIFQGPFGGGLSTARLAATVSNAGGLGAYGAHILNPGQIEALGDDMRALTDRPFSLNLWVSDQDSEMERLTAKAFQARCSGYRDLYEEVGATLPEWPEPSQAVFERQVEAVLRVRPKLFSFVFGIPSREILEECRIRNIVTMGAATTIAEAEALEAAGVDLVLATGCDAGGHRPTFLERAEDSLVGTFALVPAIRDRVSIPVIAAGGIADVRGMRAAFALGAEAVQIGTAFLACEESGAADLHRQQLLDNRDGRTVLSRQFTGRLARFMPNRVLQELEVGEKEPLPYPAQSWLTAPIKRAASEVGDVERMSLYAGQGVSLIKHGRAEDLMAELVRGLTG